MLSDNWIYGGNCLDLLTRVENESVDLIVTDPPYLINYQSKRREKSARFKTIANDSNFYLIGTYFRECYRILKPDTAIYVFCSWHNIDFFKQLFEAYFKLKNILVWVKNVHGTGDLKGQYAPRHELILFGHKGRALNRLGRTSDVFQVDKITAKKLTHPTEKPQEILTTFIENNSDEGDLVFDGFAGTGSGGLAALSLGRRFVGVELEDDYVTVANKRLQERFPGTVPETPPEIPDPLPDIEIKPPDLGFDEDDAQGGNIDIIRATAATSNWTLPTTFPDLSDANVISLDIECYDPELTEKGPGVRRDGYMVGIAVGVPGGRRWYLPFGHKEGKQFPREKVLEWARTELCRPGQAKVGANLLYDLDYLFAAGVPVTGPFMDVQIAEPLINENLGRYSLDALASRYLDEQKDEMLLTAEVRRRGYKGNVQSHLWRIDPKWVGPYAEKDVDLPLRIIKKQMDALDEQGLRELFVMESKLIPLLLKMRQVGVRVDLEKANQVRERLLVQLQDAQAELNNLAGQEINVNAAASIADAFDKLGIEYPRTAATNAPSFVKDWLERHPSRVANLITECRGLQKFISTFIEGQILGTHVNGRIHCSFNQLRSDDYGTVTGRFSSSNPNLQQVPSRDEIMGPLIRGMFVPEPDHEWGRADYSQVEYRLLAHYGVGRGADGVRERYRNDPTVDFHQICADIAGIDRGQAKNLNFAVVYGAGVDKVAAMLGVDRDQARGFLNKYHEDLPFIKGTSRIASRRADDRGWIKTVMGRRRRFNKWEPRDFDLSRKVDALEDRQKMAELVQAEIKKAREKVKRGAGKIPRGGVKRAGTYKALNALIQGSAADLLKKAMVDCYDAGVFDVITPLLTVHDELDTSNPRTKAGREAFEEMVNIMENALELRVPILVDAATGANWGECK